MIVAKSPVRITLAGGGTDIKAYYAKQQGFLIAAGIDKYSWVSVEKSDEFIYDKRNKRITEALEEMHWYSPVEIKSWCDVPIGCGLGTSGAFTVALLQALYSYYGYYHTQMTVATKACEIEIDILKEPIGRQDQWASAIGGVTCFTFSRRSGNVHFHPLNVRPEVYDSLTERLLLFDTKIPRKGVLRKQIKLMELGDGIITKLNNGKAMAYQMQDLLEAGELDDFGLLLDKYWQNRRHMAEGVTNDKIDEAYEVAMKNGALGGKLQGAGGGGFLMFYCPHDKGKLIQALESLGLRYMPFKFDYEGVRSEEVG